ncbi:MAG: hypothetical protein AAF449_00750 [Myxococcota bacterium]
MNRRQFLGAAAVLPLVEMAEPESELVRLCRRYVDLYCEVDAYLMIPRSTADQIAAERSEYAENAWAEMREIDTQVTDMPATTLAELQWKARVAQPVENASTDAEPGTVEWSLLQDLLAMAAA